MSTNFITAPRPCLGLFIFQSPRARTAPKALLLDNPIFCSYLCPKVMLLILPFVRGFQEQALCRHNWDFFWEPLRMSALTTNTFPEQVL